MHRGGEVVGAASSGMQGAAGCRMCAPQLLLRKLLHGIYMPKTFQLPLKVIMLSLKPSITPAADGEGQGAPPCAASQSESPASGGCFCA